MYDILTVQRQCVTVDKLLLDERRLIYAYADKYPSRPNTSVSLEMRFRTHPRGP